MHQLVTTLLVSSDASTLISLPFPSSLAPSVDTVLATLARKQLSSPALDASGTAPAYDRILYAWRISRDDYRGAASVLYERLERLKSAAHAHGATVLDPDDETLCEAYLVLINCLACCGREEGWILVDGDAEGGAKGRRIITLEDVRRSYQAELDRRSEMVQGRFALVGEEMDVF